MQGSAQIHENFVSTHLYAVTIHSHGRILADFAGNDVVLPSVPWTGNYRALQWTVPQRTAPMQAGTADGMELPSHIGHGDRFSLDAKLPNGPGRHFGRFRGSHKTPSPPPSTGDRATC